MPETIFGLPSLVIVWGGAMVLFVVGFTVFGIVKNKKHKSGLKDFLTKHPDASKIYEVVQGIYGIASGGVQIHSIDGEAPFKFADGMKSGVWIAPGEHRIQIEGSHTRVGVVYKSVTKSTGTIDKLVDIKPNTSYDLSFNRKTVEFSFNEREV